MLMHINSDTPNIRFSETPKPASVIPAPGEIYSNNAEVFVSVRSRSRRRGEEVGNYSASIGVEMLNPEVWDDFKLFSEINDFHWSGTQTMPDCFDVKGETIQEHFNDNSIVNILGFDRKGMFEDDPSYNAIGNFIQFSGLFGEDSIVRLMVDKIEVDCQRSDDSWDVIQGDGDQIFHFKNSHHSIEIPWDEYFLGSAVVKITAMDGVGNKASMEEEWYGVVQTLWNEFMTFMREMWEKALDVALSLGNVVYKWIVGEIEKMFQPIINNIAPAILKYLGNIEDCLVNLIEEIHDFHWGYKEESGGTRSEGDQEPITTAPEGFDLGGQLFDVMKAGAKFIGSLFGLQEQVDSFMDILNKIMKFIEPFSDLINPMKVIEILLANLPGNVGEFIDTILGTANDAIATMTTTIGSLIFGGESSLLSLLGLTTKTLRFPDLNPALTNIATTLNIPILTAIFTGLDNIPPGPYPDPDPQPDPGDDDDPPDVIEGYSKPQSLTSILIIVAKVVITAVFLKVAKDNIKDFFFGGKTFKKALDTARKNAESSTIGKAIGLSLMGLTVIGNIASYAGIFLKGYDTATNEKHNLKWLSGVLWGFSAVMHALGDAYIWWHNIPGFDSPEFKKADALLWGFWAAEGVYIGLKW